MARAKGTASTSDGSVTVVVGANGALHAITVSDSSTLTVRRSADVVVELHKLAFTRAGDAVREAVEQLEGTGSADDAACGGDAGLGEGADSDTADSSSEDAARQKDDDNSLSDSRADTDNGADRSTLSDTGSNSGFDSTGIIGGIESVATQHDPMHHVIQPFAGPEDEDRYFAATPQHPRPRPRRTPLPAETISTPEPDPIPLPPPRSRLMDAPPTHSSSNEPASANDELLAVLCIRSIARISKRRGAQDVPWSESEKYFPSSDGYTGADDRRDACRHCIWMAMMTAWNGPE